MTVVVSGFEPFDGADANPSWETAVRQTGGYFYSRLLRRGVAGARRGDP